MKDEFITRVGVLGQRHYNYLKKHFPTVINVMRMNGTLEQYLKDIDKDAQDMFDKLTKQLADSEGINEELKSANEIEWIRSMNVMPLSSAAENCLFAAGASFRQSPAKRAISSPSIQTFPLPDITP